MITITRTCDTSTYLPTDSRQRAEDKRQRWLMFRVWLAWYW